MTEHATSSTSRHELVVYFDDGDTEVVQLRCLESGSDRPCAVIYCPVDHEDVSRECIEAHGAEARDQCWAVDWYENGGRESLNTEALMSMSIPVNVHFDDGVVVENA